MIAFRVFSFKPKVTIVCDGRLTVATSSMPISFIISNGDGKTG